MPEAGLQRSRSSSRQKMIRNLFLPRPDTWALLQTPKLPILWSGKQVSWMNDKIANPSNIPPYLSYPIKVRPTSFKRVAQQIDFLNNDLVRIFPSFLWKEWCNNRKERLDTCLNSTHASKPGGSETRLGDRSIYYLQGSGTINLDWNKQLPFTVKLSKGCPLIEKHYPLLLFRAELRAHWLI